jgi:hypothetical protein
MIPFNYFVTVDNLIKYTVFRLFKNISKNSETEILNKEE